MVNEGDLVKLIEPHATNQPAVMKVARLHSMRVGHEHRLVAECLLPPHDNQNRFENWPVDFLSLVKTRAEIDAEAKAKAEADATSKADAEAKAKAKAEADAKAKADAEAKAKAGK